MIYNLTNLFLLLFTSLPLIFIYIYCVQEFPFDIIIKIYTHKEQTKNVQKKYKKHTKKSNNKNKNSWSTYIDKYACIIRLLQKLFILIHKKE